MPSEVMLRINGTDRVVRVGGSVEVRVQTDAIEGGYAKAGTRVVDEKITIEVVEVRSA